MRKKCNNAISIIIPLSITIIIIFIATALLKFNYQENLQDYGDSDSSLNGPLSYKNTMKDIKYPNIESPVYNIGDMRYNNIIFNREDAEQYNEFNITRDLKYFNNATNIILDNYFADNRENVSDTVHDYLYDNSINETSSVYNYDYPVSQENNLKFDEVYNGLLSYDDSIFPGLTKNTKYSSYYFESNFPDISNSVDKDFKYFNSVASIMSGKSLFE
tara:strand:+ start:286 stop:936 length:651 start_codon:yes stop_codon:yes gene_type:complete